MQTVFQTKSGRTTAPKFFAVYTDKKGGTFRKIQDEIEESDLDRYEDIVRIDLYENGTENLAAVLINSIYNQ